jgi:hypothetical protein
MLIQERIKIEQIYKEKDEQLKNILGAISSQFMLNAPIQPQEEHLEAEIEIESKPKKEKKKMLSLKKYLKSKNYSKKKQDKIKKRFKKIAKTDDRVVVISGKYYIDTSKDTHKQLLK